MGGRSGIPAPAPARASLNSEVAPAGEPVVHLRTRALVEGHALGAGELEQLDGAVGKAGPRPGGGALLLELVDRSVQVLDSEHQDGRLAMEVVGEHDRRRL